MIRITQLLLIGALIAIEARADRPRPDLTRPFTSTPRSVRDTTSSFPVGGDRAGQAGRALNLTRVQADLWESSRRRAQNDADELFAEAERSREWGEEYGPRTKNGKDWGYELAQQTYDRAMESQLAAYRYEQLRDETLAAWEQGRSNLATYGDNIHIPNEGPVPVQPGNPTTEVPPPPTYTQATASPPSFYSAEVVDLREIGQTLVVQGTAWRVGPLRRLRSR